MLEADKRIRAAEQLYADRAASKPTHAMERLDLELAREELAERVRDVTQQQSIRQ